MFVKYVTAISSVFLVICFTVKADTIIVDCNGKGDFLTIQEGIDFAVEGDTVLVFPCVYYENIDFLGKDISLISRDGPEMTVIDADNGEYVAQFVNEETNSCVIKEFTITNGDYGIYCYTLSSGAAPSIIKNLIINNNCGIYLGGEGGIVDGNIICNNNQNGGIYFEGIWEWEGAIIKNNIIYNNYSAYGGGICLWISPPSLVFNNLIYNNFAWWGGGISIWWSSDTIINNTIVNNEGEIGGGIWLVEGSYPLIKSNIITGNESYGIETGDAPLDITLLTSHTPDFDLIFYNDVWNNYPGNYGQGVKPGKGCISEDPLFVDPENHNYHLQPDSPCIDAGDPRLRDPDLSRSDMGCYFYRHSPIRWEERER
jgi:hypothetical protein